jgi:uncharacterized protein (TIGR03435 family)
VNRTVVLLGAVATIASAQERYELPAFETVSIKASPATYVTALMDIPPDDNIVTAFAETPIQIIAFAYDRSPKLVAGGPYWTTYDRYDIDARAPGSAVLPQYERRDMLRALLAQQFRLRFHTETRSVSAFVLVRGKSGPRMAERPADDPADSYIHLSGCFQLEGQNASIEELAKALEPIVFHRFPEDGHHLVLDKTELPGRFDFSLSFSAPELVTSGAARVLPKGPDLFHAMQQQLGLNLYKVRVRREVLVIDHIERPFLPSSFAVVKSH